MSNYTPNTDNQQPDEREEAAAVNETAAESVTEEVAEQNTAPDQKSKSKEKKVRSADTKRRLRHGRTATLITVGVIVLALMFNVVFYILGERFPLTLDLSYEGLYSLTDESIAVAKSVSDPLEIVVFAPEEVFSNTQSEQFRSYIGNVPELAQIFTEFYNALQLYSTYSGGNITLTFVDMNREPAAVSKYTEYKGETIDNGDILFISGERCKAAHIFKDLFTYDTSYTITSSIVESTLASKILSVQSSREQVLTIFTGYSEDLNLIDSLTQIYDLNGYDVEEVDLTRSVDINENTVCAVIAAPSTDYSDETIEKLRNWLNNDGKEGQNLMVFTHPTADCSNLYEFLEVEYGMEVADAIVAETDMNRIYSYNKYYSFGDIADNDFTKISSGDAAALFLNTRQIIPHWEPKTDTSIEYSVNLVTFADTAKIMPIANVGAGTEADLRDYDGTIVGMAVAVKEGYQNALQTATSTRVAVCGSYYAAAAGIIAMNTVENENLFLNAMSAMTGVTNAINIPSKSVESETISFAPSTQILVGLVFFTLILPLGLLLIGLLIFLRRRRL